MIDIGGGESVAVGVGDDDGGTVSSISSIFFPVKEQPERKIEHKRTKTKKNLADFIML